MAACSRPPSMIGRAPVPNALRRMVAVGVPEPFGHSMPVHRVPRRINTTSPATKVVSDTFAVVRHAAASLVPAAESEPAAQSTWYVAPNAASPASTNEHANKSRFIDERMARVYLDHRAVVWLNGRHDTNGARVSYCLPRVGRGARTGVRFR